MLELLRQYIVRPVWESTFAFFSMPLRAVMILISLCLVIWIVLRLKSVWKESFRSFLELLLLPERVIVKNSIAKQSNAPDSAKYGEFLNKIALRLIPLTDKKPKHLSVGWAALPILTLLILVLPVMSYRLKSPSPSTQFVDSIFLKWSSLESWVLTGSSRDQSEYYLDFISHRVKGGETITSVWNQYGSVNVISLDDIVWANQSKYPTISNDKLEPEWKLIIPVRMQLPNTYSGSSNQRNIYRVKTNEKKGLWVRTTKNMNGPTVAFVAEGGEVDLLYYDETFDVVNGKRGKWCRVKANGKEGWVWGWLITP